MRVVAVAVLRELVRPGELCVKVFHHVEVLGVRIDQLDKQQLIDYLIAATHSQRQIVVAHVNLKAMNLAFALPWYRSFLNKADVVFCDGFAVLVGAKLLGQSFKARYRMTCADYLEELAITCAQRNIALFLLAGKPGVVEAAIPKLLAVAPTLRIAGHHGYFAKQGADNDAVIDRINQFRPDILYIGFGMPLQEQWIAENKARLTAPVFLPLGGCLDVYTGVLKRAPRWMTDYGGEWLGRLLFEPTRVWKHYLIGFPLFLYRVLLQRTGLLRFREIG